jgi:hypothetical protein
MTLRHAPDSSVSALTEPCVVSSQKPIRVKPPGPGTGPK